MEGSKLLRGSFFTLACAILMALLYEIFFQVPITSNGVTVNGILQYSSLKIEHPISKYYYTYCYLPNMHMEDGIDKALNGNCANLWATKSDLTLDDTESSSFGTDFGHYTSGWY